MGQMLRKLMDWSVDNPWKVIILNLIVTLFMVYQFQFLHVDASSEGMMIEKDPDKDYYNEVVKKFGTDNITVLFVKDKSLFTPEKLSLVEKLVRELEGVKGVSKVESLFSVTNFKGSPDGLITNPLMEMAPTTQEEADTIKADALKNPNFLNAMVAKDGTAISINLFVDVDRSDRDFHPNFSNKLDEILKKYTPQFERIFQMGSSFARKEIAGNIMGDQMKITPIACIILIATVFLTLRSFVAGVMPIITSGIGTLWTFGFLGLTGIPINILTVIVPALILVIGSAEDIHMVSEYLEEVEAANGKRIQALKTMNRKLALAILCTSLTTIFGFASIIINDITMLVQFGIVSTFSLTINTLTTCMVGPAYLSLVGPIRVAHHEDEHGKSTKHPIDKFFERLADLAVTFSTNPKRKKIAIAVLLIITAIFAWGSTFIKVDNDFMGYFKEKSEIRKRNNMLHESLAGIQTFYIHINSHMPDTFKKSQYLSQVFAIEEFVREKKWFDKTQSLADQVALIHREMNNSDPKFFKVPESSDLISQYMLLLSRSDIERFVTPDYSEVSILVRHNVASSHEIAGILNELDSFIKKNINPSFSYKFTGEYILINKAAESLVLNSVSSLGSTLGAVFLCMYLMFWSVKAGLVAMGPNIFPIIINFGVMGFFGVPLNVGTAMVADIAIGIAVDDTTHFMATYNREMRELQDSPKALESCLRSQMRPVFSSSIALALGFAMVCISNFVPVIQFGLLSSLVMIVAIPGELIITPILLGSTQLITIWDMVGLDLQDHVIKDSKFFEGLRKWQIKKVILMSRVVEKEEKRMLVEKGEEGDKMYLLLEGSAQVVGVDDTTGTDKVIAKLKPGDIFGEIAVIKSCKRTADIWALEPVKYLEMDWNGLSRIKRIYPRIGSQLFLNLSRILGERLIAMNERVFGK
ncbi:MAG: MMPL family transporter [Desulfobacterales bacterium]|nr:MMPL family transporter [Desulfobacterales bacterium]